VKLVAGVVPNDTDVAPVNPEPVTVNVVPPAVGPEDGLTAVIAGGEIQVNWSANVVVEAPPIEDTVMSALPDACGGETAVSCESDTTV
jgi:hypothetical protein